ncbi:MAG TPA: PKD domain-containing protein [bacterium]|nr:PKD domain-containing protein [bacterium]
MRGLWAALLGLLVILGCGGAADNAAPPPFPTGDGPAIPAPDREGASITEGSFTLNGETVTDPGYVDSPHRVKLDGFRAGTLGLFKYRAAPIPAHNRPLYVEFEWLGGAQSYDYVRSSDGWRYYPIVMQRPGPLTLVTYNSPEYGEPLHNEAAAIDYVIELLPLEDRFEPNDDDTPQTTADRSLATPLALGEAGNYSLHTGVIAPVADVEDWYAVELDPTREYAFDIANTNHQWGFFALDLELFDADGTRVAAALDRTGNTERLTAITESDGAGTYYLRVTGEYRGEGSEWLGYLRYTVTATELPLRAPELSNVAPTDGITGFEVPFRVTNAGGPVETWAWDFGGGATPNTSGEKAPTVTLAAPGVYTGEVVASNATGESRLPFTLHVHGPDAPRVTGATPLEGFALRPATFTATTAGSAPTAWAWDFGGGATPNTSTDVAPAVRLGLAGTYQAEVRVSNATGASTFYFTYTVRLRSLALDVTAITYDGDPPRQFWQLADWAPASVVTWIDSYVNPHFAEAGIVFDPGQVRVTFLERPELYNIDTYAEEDALFEILFTDADPSQVNLILINDNNATGWAGVMNDDCDTGRNNRSRGCISASYADPFMHKVVAHELGHVLDLPHTGVGYPPIDLNYNLMGYWTEDLGLSHDIITEQPGYFCQLYQEEQMDQFQVVHDWVYNISGLP